MLPRSENELLTKTRPRCDTAVIRMRKFLLESVRRVQQGEEPPHIVRGSYSPYR